MHQWMSMFDWTWMGMATIVWIAFIAFIGYVVVLVASQAPRPRT
jgi:disulfide bond formation protein DsbB